MNYPSFVFSERLVKSKIRRGWRITFIKFKSISLRHRGIILISSYNSIVEVKMQFLRGSIPLFVISGMHRYSERPFRRTFDEIRGTRKDRGNPPSRNRSSKIYPLVGRFPILPKQWRPINRCGRVKSNEIVWNGSVTHSRWQHVKYKWETRSRTISLEWVAPPIRRRNRRKRPSSSSSS